LYAYFFSPFKNISFFTSYLSALASPKSLYLGGSSLLGGREAKHTAKLNKQKKTNQENFNKQIKQNKENFN